MFSRVRLTGVSARSTPQRFEVLPEDSSRSPRRSFVGLPKTVVALNLSMGSEWSSKSTSSLSLDISRPLRSAVPRPAVPLYGSVLETPK
jgi:hypothetical protein